MLSSANFKLFIEVAVLSFASAADFLGQPAAMPPATALDAQHLLQELGFVLGDEHRARAEERMGRLTITLLPTFRALPRTPEDRLGSDAVRYLLHRYFVDRHGFFVQGLEAGGQSWNSSSPAEVLNRRVGSELGTLFEERLANRGLSLHEVAVLAATLEGLVHAEVLERLREVYRLSDVSAQEHDVSDEALLQVIDNYMLIYVLGLDYKTLTKKVLQKSSLSIHEVYPNWPQVRVWVRQVRGEVMASIPTPRPAFTTTVRVLEELADQFGRWQHSECLNLKGKLMKLEQPGTGRVPLRSFYGAALKGDWQFSEKNAYLRQMGSLDESDSKQPSVVIPNYINGPSNCIASSAFYSVCCISECESIQADLERDLGAPEVEPGRVAELVAALPSATVAAPRQLPAELMERLQEVSALHGGRVPLHSRLFAQWLHHAYPHECPFPHVSGSRRPVTTEQWVKETGQAAVDSSASLRKQVESLSPSREVHVPWIGQEELFVGPAPPGGPVTMAAADVAGALLLVATVLAVSTAVTLMRALASARAAVPQARSKVSV